MKLFSRQYCIEQFSPVNVLLKHFLQTTFYWTVSPGSVVQYCFLETVYHIWVAYEIYDNDNYPLFLIIFMWRKPRRIICRGFLCNPLNYLAFLLHLLLASACGQNFPDFPPPFRSQWSSSYHTRLWIRDSRVQTQPGSMDFSERKNPNMASFGREVKPWVPCRRPTSTSRKRTSSRN